MCVAMNQTIHYMLPLKPSYTNTNTPSIQVVAHSVIHLLYKKVMYLPEADSPVLFIVPKI